jgi:hypothetical protein
MRSAKITVTDTATLIIAADDTNRTVYLKHSHENHPLHLGNASVTTATGYQLKKDETLTLVVPQKQTLYGITTENDEVDVFIITPDID